MLIYFLQDSYNEIADQIFKLREQREKCTVNGWMWSDTDPTVRWHPQNIKFIGGTFRILLEFLICLTPGGQGVILCEEGVEHLIFLPLCSAFVIFSTSLIGSRSFKKKNLK